MPRNKEYDELRYFGQASKGGAASSLAAISRLNESEGEGKRYNRIKKRQLKKSLKNYSRFSDGDSSNDPSLNKKRKGRFYKSFLKDGNPESQAAEVSLDDYDFNRKTNPGKYSNILYNLARGSEEVDKPLQQSIQLTDREATDVSTMSKKDAAKTARAQQLQGYGMTAAQSASYKSRVARQQSESNEKANFAQYQENKRVEELNAQSRDKETLFAKQSELRASDDFDIATSKKKLHTAQAMKELADESAIEEQASMMYGKDLAQWELDKERYRNLETSEFKTTESVGKVAVKRKGANFKNNKFKMYPDGTIDLR